MHGFKIPCIMRKGTGSLQISPRRLLSLLLLQIIAALAIQQVNGSRYHFSHKLRHKDKQRYTGLIGGVPFVKNHLLMSRCSSRHVQMKHGKKINARGSRRSAYANLRFESDPSDPRYVRIQGDVSHKFLCFSKRGRLIARSIGESQRCKFKEELHHGYIKLQSAVETGWYVGFNSRGRKLYGYKSKSRLRRFRNCFMFTKTDWRSRHWRRQRKNRRHRGPITPEDLEDLRLRKLNSRNR